MKDKKESAIELYRKGEVSLEGAAKFADLYIGEFLDIFKNKYKSIKSMDELLQLLVEKGRVSVFDMKIAHEVLYDLKPPVVR